MTTTDPQSEIDQLQAQQALTVKVLRSALEGDWDSARIQLDAIDPGNVGKWSNVPFPFQAAT